MFERMAEPRALVHSWGVLSSNTFVSSWIVPLVSLLLLLGAPPARAAPSNPPSVLNQLILRCSRDIPAPQTPPDRTRRESDLQDIAVASAIGGAIVGAATFSYAQIMRSPPPVSAVVGSRGAFVGVTVSW